MPLLLDMTGSLDDDFSLCADAESRPEAPGESLTWYTARGGGRRARGVAGGVRVSPKDSRRRVDVGVLPGPTGDGARAPRPGEAPLAGERGMGDGEDRARCEDMPEALPVFNESSEALQCTEAPTPGPGRDARRGKSTSLSCVTLPRDVPGVPKLPRRPMKAGERFDEEGEGLLLFPARRPLPRPRPLAPPVGAAGGTSSLGFRGGSPPRPWYTGMPDTLQGMAHVHSPSHTPSRREGHDSPSPRLTCTLVTLPLLVFLVLLTRSVSLLTLGSPATLLERVVRERVCARGRARVETGGPGPAWPSAPHVTLAWPRGPPRHAPSPRLPTTPTLDRRTPSVRWWRM